MNSIEDRPTQSNDSQANLWGMILHLSIFSGYLVPIAGLIAPIVIWQIKKDEFPIIDEHGRNVVNWIIWSLIYLVAGFVLMFVVIGIFVLTALAICSIVFPIIGAVKAHEGKVWDYPLMPIRFV